MIPLSFLYIANATKLYIFQDGHSTNEDYGRDLDQLVEGDRVGVMRTSNGALHFFVNGIDQGPADTRVPSRLFAVVDMYGKCAQVTLVGDSNRDKGKRYRPDDWRECQLLVYFNSFSEQYPMY